MRVSAAAIVALLLALCVTVGAPAPASIAASTAGYADFSFGSTPGADPTADKPQSKLWHNDGSWWSIMFHSGSGTWHIYRLIWPDEWVDTGVVVDNRPTSRADVLWDGAKLYVASLVRLNSSNQGRLYRFSYNAGSDTYTLDGGFPAQIMTGSAETLVLDKDTTGRLWVTYTQNKRVYVASSSNGGGAWTTPFTIPGATQLNSDDISTLVAYQDSIGVLWSNQNDDKMYFSYHRDSDPDDAWQPIVAVYSGSNNADDHINLKSLQTDGSGRLFAAVKTSRTGSSDPLLLLLWRDAGGAWGSTVFGVVRDQHTRPLVLLDHDNQKVYMFATAPTSCGAIYMKSTSMDAPSFADQTGKGTPFISSSTYTCINNVTSTKQTVGAATGLVALASDESKKFYLHNAITLGAPPPDTTAPEVVGRAPAAGATSVSVATNVAVTFSEAVTGVSASSFTLRPQGGPAVAASVTYSAATRTATLDPSAELAPGVTYTATLGSPIADAAGNPLATVSWSFTTATPPDTTPPQIADISPTDGATAVDRATSITVTFSEPIDPATIDGGSFELTQAGEPVAAIVTYDSSSKTAALAPADTLAPAETYTARIAGVRDLAGNSLGTPFTWDFTTAPEPAPELKTYVPLITL